MKNKLITAFLTFATIATFAQQPNNAELLAHLKNVKADIKNRLTQLTIEVKDFAKEFGPGYKEIETVWTKIHALAPIKKASLEEINIYFDLICNQMKTFKDITNINQESVNLAYIAGGLSRHIALDDETKKLQQSIESIFKKQFKNKSESIEKIMNNFFISGESLTIAMIISSTDMYNSLLKKIDAKIKELEAQA